MPDLLTMFVYPMHIILSLAFVHIFKEYTKSLIKKYLLEKL